MKIINIFFILTIILCNSCTKTEYEKTALTRQIEATDKQIDKLVYELYELTEDEIKIIEKG